MVQTINYIKESTFRPFTISKFNCIDTAVSFLVKPILLVTEQLGVVTELLQSDVR
jgi:hypothetical protein